MGQSLKEKIKLTLLRLFDNPLSNYLIFKIIYCIQCSFGLFTNIKRGLGLRKLGFGAHIEQNIFKFFDN